MRDRSPQLTPREEAFGAGIVIGAFISYVIYVVGGML